MKKVLFVCLGNICRSPTAEAVFRGMLSERGLSGEILHDSCGTAGYHVGEPPDHRAQQAAGKRGYPMADLRGRQLADEDFETFDYLLAMDRANLSEMQKRAPRRLHHKLHLLREFSEGGVLEIPDPYYGGEAGFDLVLDLVEEACNGLLDSILANQSRSPK